MEVLGVTLILFIMPTLQCVFYWYFQHKKIKWVSWFLFFALLFIHVQIIPPLFNEFLSFDTLLLNLMYGSIGCGITFIVHGVLLAKVKSNR